MMHILCRGRAVDDQGRPEGDECGRTYHGPTLPSRLIEQARAAGWSIAPDGHPDHTQDVIVGTCPRCRRPAPEVVELAREVGRLT